MLSDELTVMPTPSFEWEARKRIEPPSPSSLGITSNRTWALADVVNVVKTSALWSMDTPFLGF
jgi:hypothetical protein